MKKLGSIAFIALFATLALSACKKDYTCNCSIHDSFQDTTYTTSATIHDSKSDAKDGCNAGNSTTISFGDTITVSCAIE